MDQNKTASMDYSKPRNWIAAINVSEGNKLELPLELSKNLHSYELALINYSTSFDKNINRQSIAITCDGLQSNHSYITMQ